MRNSRAARSAGAACAVLLLQAACGRRASFDPDAASRRGLLLRERGELAAALAVANDGLARFEDQSNSRWYWNFRLLKAEVLLGEGDNSRAAMLLPDPTITLNQAPDLQVRLLVDHGWLRSAVGDYGESLRFLDQALTLAKPRGLPQLAAQAELRRVGDLTRLDRITEAGLDAEHALEFAKQSGDTTLQSSALGNLGYIDMNTDRFDEAVLWFQRALELSDQSKSVTALTLNNMGECYVELGQPEKAFQMFQRAEALAAESGDATDRQISLGRIGDWYQNTGDDQRALSYYAEALAIARRSDNPYWSANWLHNLTETAIQMGDFERATDYNREALQIQANMDDPAERLWPEIDHARITDAAGRTSEAERIYRSVIQGAQSLHSQREPSLVLAAHAGLANLLVAAHRGREAEDEFRRALLLINNERAALKQDEYKISYFSSLVSFYQGYVDLLASEHREAAALRVAESSRARVLSEELDTSDRLPVERTHVDYRKLASSSGAILFSYWLAPRRSYLWVVTPARVSQFELPPQAQIESLTRDYNKAIRQLRDPLREGSNVGRKLYEVLLAPAERLVPVGSSVAIVPDGELHNLNFETLPDSASRYWIEDARLSVVPSLDLASRGSRAIQKHPATLLLIGNPVPPDGVGFGRLSEAGPEMEGIQSHFSDATLRTGADATPGAYAAANPQGFSMIHFAAHAQVNPEDPLDSAIILSPQAERYKLYAREVIAVPIRADLVTISACQGASGRTYAGEGLVGFAWSFLRAGARNVIAGLWEVDDRSTAELMDALYTGLGEGMPPPEALRRAQLSLLNSQTPHRKPYYWGPFQLISDSLAK